jgi:hypothetical protein
MRGPSLSSGVWKGNGKAAPQRLQLNGDAALSRADSWDSRARMGLLLASHKRPTWESKARLVALLDRCSPSTHAPLAVGLQHNGCAPRRTWSWCS